MPIFNDRSWLGVLAMCVVGAGLAGCSSAPEVPPGVQPPPAPLDDLFGGLWVGTARSGRTGGEGDAVVTFAKVDMAHYVMQFGGPEDPTLAVPITVDYRPDEVVFAGTTRAAGKPYRINGMFRSDGSLFARYVHGEDDGIVKLKREPLPGT